MEPKPMPVRISKPGLKNVFEYRNFRKGSIFLPARLASREVAVVSNPFQPAFSIWVTSQFASIHQTASAWTCEIWSCRSKVEMSYSQQSRNVLLLRILRQAESCHSLLSGVLVASRPGAVKAACFCARGEPCRLGALA